MATRCKFALNYSQCSSCLRNLWSALLSVKSPFKGLSVETGEEGYVHDGSKDKLTHHGCHWILHLRMCLRVASTQAARCRESVAISSRHGGRKINQLGFLQNLLILSWVTFCLNRYEKWNFFQQLAPAPCREIYIFFLYLEPKPATVLLQVIQLPPAPPIKEKIEAKRQRCWNMKDSHMGGAVS